MREDVIIEEIAWEYDCSKDRAKSIVQAYKSHGKYKELCEIVTLKRTKPDFNLIGGESDV